jgi:adenine deaminase
MYKKFEGNIVDIFESKIYFGEITTVGDKIFNVKKIGAEASDATYFLPGFVDAHVHVESSMLCPSQFAKLAVKHGTVGTVSDPHEIANVLGIEGINFMIEDARKTPFKFSFGAPSCVPATSFETAGATIDANDILELLQKPEITYLAEMMNFPGVLAADEQVMSKIVAAQQLGKPIDGHAPGLMGVEAQTYFKAGISTDHECYMLEEAEEKLKLGVKVLIREGSAAKNFDTLIPLAKTWGKNMMFCSDDKHPDELLLGHIDKLVIRALAAGVELFTAIRMATINPVLHYNMNVGLLREGDSADFIEVTDLKSFEVKHVYINGQLVAKDGVSLLEPALPNALNNFSAEKLYLEDIKIEKPELATKINVIQVIDGQLITEKVTLDLRFYNESLENWLQGQGIQKLVVYNRYKKSLPAIAYIRGFGLTEGALGSTVAHDSHNIIAVGVNDQDIIDVINRLILEKGGICAASNKKLGIIPLPIAGIMSDQAGERVAEDYSQLNIFAKDTLGSMLTSPFMSLSFMALLVIPALKLSDKGLFDGSTFEFSGIFESTIKE